MDIRWKGPGGQFAPGIGTPSTGEVIRNVDNKIAEGYIRSNLAERVAAKGKSPATKEDN